MENENPKIDVQSTPSVDDRAVNEEVRVIQSVHMQRSMPVLLFGNAGAVAIIAYFNWTAVLNSFAWLPFAILLALLGPMLHSYLKLRKNPRPQSVSQRRIRMIIRYSLLMGLAWAAALWLLFPYLQRTDGIMVFMIVLFLSYSSVALTISLPLASAVYFVPMLLVSYIGCIANHIMPFDILTVLYIAGGLALVKTMMQNWQDVGMRVRADMERLQAQTELHRREAETARNERNQQSEETENMRAMIDAIPFPVVMTKGTGALMASKEAARQFGVTADKLAGLDITDFYVDQNDYQELLNIQERDGDVSNFECRLKDTKGKEFWAVISNRVVDYQDAQCRLSAIFISDDRKRAEEALREKEAQLRLTLNHMNGGIRFVDEKRNYVFFNSKYCELYDFPGGLFKVGDNSRIENLYRAERGDMGPGDPQKLVDEWLAKYPVLSEPTRWDHTTITGKTLQVYTSPTPVGGFINIVSDISEQRQLEAEREFAEKVALEKTRILEQTLEHMGQGLTMYDTEWNLLSYNQRYMEHFDLPPELFHENATFDDIVGATMGLDYGPERDERLKVVKDPSRMTSVWRREFTRPGGRSLDVLSNPIPTGGFVVTTTDISDRINAEKELAAKEGQLRAALDNMSDGILMVDEKLRVSMRNDKYLVLMDLDPETVPLGGDVYQAAKVLAAKGFYGPGEPEDLARQRYQYFKTQEATRMELRTPTGRDLDVRQEPTPDGAAVITYTDITERKIYETEIKAAMDKAENLARLRADFVATVSHEVRTPMNGVLGMAQLLLEMKLSDESRECVDIILRSGNSLLRIVDDLLDIAKLDAERLELERIPFHFADVVADAVQLMDVRAMEKGLKLSATTPPELPPVLRGDPFRLRQILLNLISNAIKFTDHGSVDVEISLLEIDMEKVNLQLDVVDTGKGVSEEAHEKLFSEYAQESIDVARKYGGTGLGLAICRRLAGMMGGEITLQSAISVGSRFRLVASFEIDHETDRAQLLVDTQSDEADLIEVAGTRRSLSVLQVEDDEINREVVKRTLIGANHRIASVADGVAALQILAEQSFDIILMDRHMPEMNGLETTRRIRELPGETGKMPILGITASAIEAELKACLDAGMDEVLTKPINRRKFLHTLDRMTGDASVGSESRTNGMVLVIDGIEINRLLAEKYLQIQNLPCEFADDGEVALDMAMRQEYAAILVDVSMPQLDGMAFIELLRDWERVQGRRTPVIAMSGLREPGDRQRYLDAGMDDFFEKPISLFKITSAVDPWLAVFDQGEEDTGKPEKERAATVLDLTIMREIYGDIDEDAKRMLDLFQHTVEDYIEKLNEAIIDSDLDAAGIAAHSAAGASWNAGANELGTLFSDLEAQFNKNSLVDAASRASVIDEALERFKKEVSKL